jgi:hypothetical protein
MSGPSITHGHAPGVGLDCTVSTLKSRQVPMQAGVSWSTEGMTRAPMHLPSRSISSGLTFRTRVMPCAGRGRWGGKGGGMSIAYIVECIGGCSPKQMDSAMELCCLSRQPHKLAPGGVNHPLQVTCQAAPFPPSPSAVFHSGPPAVAPMSSSPMYAAWYI